MVPVGMCVSKYVGVLVMFEWHWVGWGCWVGGVCMLTFERL